MSKRLSGGKNTIFNYFQPLTPRSSKENIPDQSNLPVTNNETLKVRQEKRESNESGKPKWLEYNIL